MSHSNWTNREQKEKLIKIMEENPEIAKGFFTTRVDTERFWKETAEKLNSCGPPSKDGATWKKVWSDFKSKTKKKLLENEMKRKQSGCNDNNLTALTEYEEAIVRLTALNQSVTGLKTRVFGLSQYEESEVVSTSRDVSMTSNPEESMTQVPLSEPGEDLPDVSNRNRAKKDTPVQILQKQSAVQESFFAELNSKLECVKDELHRLNRYHQKADEMQRKIYEENRRHNLAVEQLMHEKLDLKRRILEMQLNQVKDKLAEK